MIKGARSGCYEDVGLEGHRPGATPIFDTDLRYALLVSPDRISGNFKPDGDLRQFLPQSFYDHSAQ